MVESTPNPPGNVRSSDVSRDVNPVINVQGLLSGSTVQFFLDSGAAQSLVCYDRRHANLLLALMPVCQKDC